MATPQQLAMASETGQVPPTQMVYSDLLSVSYPAKKTQTAFTASNGDSFDTTGKNTIEIPISIGTGNWIDLSNSYFKITITNTTANAIGFKTPHDLIDRFQILGTNSEMLEDVQNYNSLARLLCIHQLGEDGWTYNTNLGEFQTSSLFSIAGIAAGTISKATVDAALNSITGAEATEGYGTHHGQLDSGKIAAGASLTICFPLISGIINSGKYLPLGMLKNRSLTFRIQLAAGMKAYASAANTAPTATYNDVSFIADVISMSEVYNNKFMDMMRSVGDISIHYTTYKNYQDSKSAIGSVYNGLIPDSSRSLKSIFTLFNPQTLANQVDNLRLINPQLTEYQYTIQSETYPQKDVQAMSSKNRNQAFANLHIALGQLGSLHSRCMGTSDSYYPTDVKATCNSQSTTFAIGVCVESHNKSSNLLESGVNLSNSTQPCRVTCKVDAADSLNVLHYTLSDRLLTISESGDLRSSG
jgi:hypothetical protein